MSGASPRGGGAIQPGFLPNWNDWARELQPPQAELGSLEKMEGLGSSLVAAASRFCCSGLRGALVAALPAVPGSGTQRRSATLGS